MEETQERLLDSQKQKRDAEEEEGMNGSKEEEEEEDPRKLMDFLLALILGRSFIWAPPGEGVSSLRWAWL